MGPQDLCLYLKGLWEDLQVPRDLQVLRHLFKMVLLDPKDPRDLCLPNQDLLELKWPITVPSSRTFPGNVVHN